MDFLMPFGPGCHLTWEGTGRFQCFVIVTWHPHLCAFLYAFQQGKVVSCSGKEVLIV